MSFFTFPYNKNLSLESLLSFGLSFLILLYAFSLFWLGNRFAFQNQAGLLVGITALSAIGCTIILIKRIFTSNHPKTFTQLDLLLFVFLTYLLVQMLFYPINKEYILQLICLASVYFLFRQLPPQSTNIFLYLLPIMAVFQIIYTHSRLTEPWQGFSDITGGFGNTGIFGGFVAMGFVAALGLLLSSKQFAIRIFLCVLLIPISIQLFYTQSRAAWLAAIIGTAVLLLFPVFRKLKKPKVTIAIVFGLIICALLLLISLYYFKKDSADGRVLIWTVSAKMLTEKPITGFGVDGFQKNYLLRQGEYFKNNPDSTFADLADNSHSTFNEWLKIGVEQGIIGLLFVIGILFMAFRYSAHSPSLWAIMAALFVFSCFSYPFEFMAFKILAVFCLADIQSPVLFGTQITQIDTKYFLAKVNLRLHKLGLCRFSIVSICVIALRRTLFRVICVPLIISACGFTIYFSHNYFSGIKEWNRAYYAYSSEEKTDKLQALYPDLKRNAMFVSVYGKALYDNERYSEAIPILEKAKKLFPATQTFILLGDAYEKTGAYSEALDVWQTASYIMPVLFTPHYNMAKLYQKLDDNERAKQKAELILNKRIKINSPRIVRMKREMEVLMNN